MIDLDEYVECPICFKYIYYEQWDEHYKNEHKKEDEKHNCPKCGNEYYGYSALSRVDNKTEICNHCGTKEALTAFLTNT